MLLDKLLMQVAPYECVACRAEGRLLCANCIATLPRLRSKCYRCQQPSANNRTCLPCRQESPLEAVRAVTAYRSAAKDIIWRLKSDGAQAAATEMAALMAPLLTPKENMLLVPISTASSRVRGRGYDQARLLARGVAKRTALPYAVVLRRVGQHHQVGAGREQRVTQLAGAYRCARPDLVRNQHIVLIDDVLTTGATLEAAAVTLLAHGASRVSGLVFAQA